MKQKSVNGMTIVRKKFNISPAKLAIAKEKRQLLEKLSSALIISVKLGKYPSVNAGLVELYKEQTGRTTFKSYSAWASEGYSIKKGESGFPVWSRPEEVSYETETIDEAGNVKTSTKLVYRMSYLFHENQVEKKG